MTINLSVPVTHDLKPRLTVMGVGGAGCNAVNNMITAHLEGVDVREEERELRERGREIGEQLLRGGGGARPPRDARGRRLLGGAQRQPEDRRGELRCHRACCREGLEGGSGEQRQSTRVRGAAVDVQPKTRKGANWSA